MTRSSSLRRPAVTNRWVATVALVLSGCTSSGDTVDPVYAEKAIRQMLGHAASVPMPSDLPKISDADLCIRVNLVLDNPKLSSAVKSQYIEAGREKNCERALAAQSAAQ
jgi:hypothetical protein